MNTMTYTTKRFHPKTGLQTECRVFLNFFGVGQDGYVFAGEKTVHTQEEMDQNIPTFKAVLCPSG